MHSTVTVLPLQNTAQVRVTPFTRTSKWCNVDLSAVNMYCTVHCTRMYCTSGGLFVRQSLCTLAGTIESSECCSL